MSGSEVRLADDDPIAEVTRRFADAVDNGRPGDVPDEELGRIFGAAIRLLAAKAQAGGNPEPVAGNSGITATDGVIACTAILEAVGVEVFELSAWQALTDVGSRRRARHGIQGDTA